MTQKYFPVLTEIGLAKLTNASLLNQQIKLTHMAVGDGNGNEIDPTELHVSLVNEVYRAPINELAVDDNAADMVKAVLVVPLEVGGFNIRELGLFDEVGDLIAIASFPATYKPLLEEGTGREIRAIMKLRLSNTESVTLKIDPTVVLATLDDVAKSIKKHEQTKHYAGEFKSFPFRPDELPEYWYFRNGEFVAKDTSVGKRLLAMSTNYKLDHSIIETETHISLPNAFDENGDGYFDRPVDGVSRQVGSVQGDAIRNFTGETHELLGGYETGIPASGIIEVNDGAVINIATTGGSYTCTTFSIDASRQIPTSHENRPINYGSTPAVFLPPVEA